MNVRHTYFEQIFDLLKQKTSFVSVTLVDITGSAPAFCGAKILVDHSGLLWGTIGGGKIENHCIQEALQLLNSETGHTNVYKEWNLQTDIGMTCGGIGRFFFEHHRANPWEIAVFGAGHVAQALVPVLCALDCQVYCYDTRQDWIDRLPVFPNLEAKKVAVLSEQVSVLNPQTFIVSMTMGHAHDVPILAEAIQRQSQKPGCFPYLGVIGSPAKAGVIRRDLLKLGFNKKQLESLICPIGLPLGSNAPTEIAISVVGQLLQERDRKLNFHNKWA